MNPTNTAAGPAMTDIRDIKPPYEISSGSVWIWWVVAGVVLAVAAYLLWRWQGKKSVAAPAPPPMPAHIRAKLRLLEALGLIHDPKPFCVLVSDTVRHYLEDRFEIRAPEQTTEEFLRELRRTDRLQVHQKDSLGDFMANCDSVKFAKYEPGEKELRELHGAALRLVEETAPEPAAGPGGPVLLNPVSRSQSQ